MAKSSVTKAVSKPEWSLLNAIKQKLGHLLDRIRGVTISSQYLELNKQLHEKLATYGTSASKWADVVKELYVRSGASSILDYGCGKALLSKSVGSEIKVVNYDPAIPEYSTKPKPADFVVCSDVLEHIEPHLLSTVLKDISRLTKKVSFIVVSTRPAGKFLADGRNAHLIQEKSDWWEKKLTGVFPYVEGLGWNEKLGEAAFVCGTDRGVLGNEYQSTVSKLRNQVESVFDATLKGGFTPPH